MPATLPTVVVDAALALTWQLDDGSDLDSADHLLLDYLNGKVHLAAPDLWLSDVASGLRAAVARGYLSDEQGRAALDDYLALGIALHPFAPLVPRAFELANAHGLTIHASASLALAERLDAPFYTANRPLFERLGGSVGRVRWFGEYHA